MLKKYENFTKLSKTQQCNLYQANKRQDMNKVLIKKVKSSLSWNQMLKSKVLKLHSSESMFPKVLEIFKSNGSYFFVYQRPQGPSLSFEDQSIKLQIDEFYQISRQIINSVKKLKEEITDLYIYPEWIFLHRNGVKICHFEPYFQEKNKSNHTQGHVFMYDIMNRVYPKQTEEDNQTQGKRRTKNLNFNLGYIFYHLIAGKRIKVQPNDKDYQDRIKEIQLNCEEKIMNQFNDQKLAFLITKLLSIKDNQNILQMDSNQQDPLQQFKSFINKKFIECLSCKKNRQKFRIVEFSLEKMKLQKKMSKIKVEKKKKCFRLCCSKKFQDEPNPQDQRDNNNRYEIVQKFTKEEKIVKNDIKRIDTENNSSQNKYKFQPVQNSGKTVNRHQRNSSCFFPSLGSQRRVSLLLQKTDSQYNRPTMFSHSLKQASKMNKSYLKTQY